MSESSKPDVALDRCRCCGQPVRPALVRWADEARTWAVRVLLNPTPTPHGQVVLSSDGINGVSLLHDDWVGRDLPEEVVLRRFRLHRSERQSLGLDGSCPAPTMRTFEGAWRDLPDVLVG